MLASRQVFLKGPQLPTLTPPVDVDTAARLRTAIGRLSRRLRTTAAARDARLTPTSISLLLGVVRSGPVRLSELADSEGVNPTMLSRSVGGMVEQGLLTRASDEGDRRAAWVQATPAGRRLAERMRRERTEAVNAALEELSESHQRWIEQALPALEALAEALRGKRP